MSHVAGDSNGPTNQARGVSSFEHSASQRLNGVIAMIRSHQRSNTPLPASDFPWLVKLLTEVANDIDALDRSESKLIGERDVAEDWADKLAEVIATDNNLEIGEHSSCNNPWLNAWTKQSE